MRKPYLFLIVFIGFISAHGQQRTIVKNASNANTISPGANRLDQYLPLLKGKSVGIFANQTSMVGGKHLVDTLQDLGIKIRVIFGPEHGFRGNADAGEKVGDYIDEKTGIPVISLYGAKRKPTEKDLQEVDILIFDIQDVGTRFYTFISSLEAYMESAIEFNKPLIVLDRPNPNGHYVDGPVLDTSYRSFVGMQPVPIVYGMTIGEYAKMLLGEKWIREGKKEPAEASASLDPAKVSASAPEVLTPMEINDEKSAFKLTVIPCENYTHKSSYILPVRPSPNLATIQSIYLYPTTCLFEGTVLSEGRGTDRPFQLIGHPNLPKSLISFTPNPNEGAKNSKHYGKLCYGWDFGGTAAEVKQKVSNKIQLNWLLRAYQLYPVKDSFFLIPKTGDPSKSFFNKLAGNSELAKQIKAGETETEIRKSWEPAIMQFKTIRKRYLLYPDFE
jgi:uncharacterized protein YbbC (DUF1343 family)